MRPETLILKLPPSESEPPFWQPLAVRWQAACQRRPWLKLVAYVLESLLYVLGYKYCGQFSLGFVIPGTASTPLWLGAGFSLAVLLLRGARFIPAIFVSIAVAEIDFFSYVVLPQSPVRSVTQHLLAWLGVTTAVTVNHAVSYYAITRLLGTDNPFRRMRQILLYVVLTAFTFMIGATLAVPIMRAEGTVTSAGLMQLWRNWWLGDYASAISVTAMLVVLMRHRGQRISGLLYKLPAFLAAYALIVYLVFYSPVTSRYPLLWLLYSLLMAAGLLFGEQGTVLVGFSASLLALAATVQGMGPFAQFPTEYVINAEQLFIGFFMISALIFAALFNEKQRMLDELTEAHRTAQEATARAIDSNRVKSEFLANMSHEIRTPLNAVIGFTELLARALTDKQQLSYLQAIKSGGQALLTLINDILDLSKIEAGKMELQYEPVALHDLLGEVVRIFAQKADEKRLQLELVVDETLPTCLILDEARLRQVLFNLVGNALKFTEQGYVRLSASSILNQLDDSKVDMVIAVEDTGVGIAPHALRTIFEAFTQQEKQDTKKYGGTGLGLSISRKFVSLMGGQIEVESQLGRGSTFRVYLTGVSISASDAAAAGPPIGIDRIRFEPASLLLVDDIAVNRELIKEIFRAQPFEILQAENGQEAVALARRHLPNLVLTDIRMPVMDGFEELRQLRSEPATRHIPVVALTASVMEHEIHQLQESGFDGYLRKPAKLENIYRELMKLLPYRLAEETPEADAVAAAGVEDLTGLIVALEAEPSELYRILSKNQKMHLLDKFAAVLEQLLQTWPLPALEEYHRLYLESLDSFDSDKIERVLQDFPLLLDRLKSLSKENS